MATSPGTPCPGYVSATGKNVNATDGDGQAALPYLHEFVTLLAALRVVVVMGVFASQPGAAASETDCARTGSRMAAGARSPQGPPR